MTQAPTIPFPVDEQRFLEIYSQYFPGQSMDDVDEQVLHFAGDVAVAAFYNGLSVADRLLTQQGRSAT